MMERDAAYKALYLPSMQWSIGQPAVGLVFVCFSIQLQLSGMHKPTYTMLKVSKSGSIRI